MRLLSSSHQHRPHLWAAIAGTALATALLAVLGMSTAAGRGAGGSGAGQDVHYFQINLSSSGSAAADYGRDRERPGITQGAGVDGKTAAAWSLNWRAVGKAVGNGPLRSTQVNFKGWMSQTQEDLVSWTVLNGGPPNTTPLCEPEDSGTYTSTLNRGDQTGADPTPNPSWIRSDVDVNLTGREIQAFTPGYLPSGPCLHGAVEGIRYVGDISGGDAKIPRGAFNPRSDRSYSNTLSSAPPPEATAQHGYGGGLHSSGGSSKLTIEIDSVTKREAGRLGERYQETSGGRLGSSAFEQ
jgi:hypothetical protein